MKILFVGEGRHDIGASSFAPQPRTASGVVATLSRKIRPMISGESVALSWTEISLLSRSKKGLEHKLVAARELVKRHGCDGIIAVIDQDGDGARIQSLKVGQQRIASDVMNSYPVAVGVAIESIEAWTLGDPDAVGTVVNSSREEVLRHYKLSRVESYYERSGDVSRRPKRILELIAALIHTEASETFRREVAELTDIATLERVCPNGFAPFAEDVRVNFPESQRAIHE